MTAAVAANQNGKMGHKSKSRKHSLNNLEQPPKGRRRDPSNLTRSSTGIIQSKSSPTHSPYEITQKSKSSLEPSAIPSVCFTAKLPELKHSGSALGAELKFKAAKKKWYNFFRWDTSTDTFDSGDAGDSTLGRKARRESQPSKRKKQKSWVKEIRDSRMKEFESSATFKKNESQLKKSSADLSTCESIEIRDDAISPFHCHMSSPARHAYRPKYYESHRDDTFHDQSETQSDRQRNRRATHKTAIAESLSFEGLDGCAAPHNKTNFLNHKHKNMILQYQRSLTNGDTSLFDSALYKIDKEISALSPRNANGPGASLCRKLTDHASTRGNQASLSKTDMQKFTCANGRVIMEEWPKVRGSQMALDDRAYGAIELRPYHLLDSETLSTSPIYSTRPRKNWDRPWGVATVGRDTTSLTSKVEGDDHMEREDGEAELYNHEAEDDEELAPKERKHLSCQGEEDAGSASPSESEVDVIEVGSKKLEVHTRDRSYSRLWELQRSDKGYSEEEGREAGSVEDGGEKESDKIGTPSTNDGTMGSSSSGSIRNSDKDVRRRTFQTGHDPRTVPKSAPDNKPAHKTKRTASTHHAAAARKNKGMPQETKPAASRKNKKTTSKSAANRASSAFLKDVTRQGMSSFDLITKFYAPHPHDLDPPKSANRGHPMFNAQHYIAHQHAKFTRDLCLDVSTFDFIDEREYDQKTKKKFLNVKIGGSLM